ncbi:CRISPR-associated endonuclease Cas2 [Enterococcus sp. CSURQ0835]|uniref:CRISPR-associated endonuclease Cas2 n=1 Tax=Enterococcus sp. CSURQ0835 TaxID=2681394 RepID=UPI0013570B54|nr:CRISPR-associated endonuclease Cas2 [Enterococcus sp. CSURQ0835]
MYIILVYDISLDEKGSRVLNRIFKLCKKYLTHVQKSVFEGEITPAKLKELELQLSDLIRDDLDSVVIFKNTNKRWLEKSYLGISLEDELSNFF